MKFNLFDKLQRPIQKAGLIREIDGFRFFAIFTVCILHLNNFYGRSLNYDYYQNVNDLNSWSWFINRSGLGVEIFFAISGFVIALPFFYHYLEGRKAPSLKQYFYRRLTRLEVPFILSCLLIYTGYVFTSGTTFLSGIGHLLAASTYTHHLVYGYWPPFNPVTWSLEVEIQFYLLAPFIFRLLFLSKRIWVQITTLLVLFTITVVLRGYFHDDLSAVHLNKSIFTNLHYFLIGFVLVYLYITQREFLTKKHFIWDIIGIGSFYLLYFYIWQSNQAYFCGALMMLSLCIFKGQILNWICTRKAIYVVGGMCYTIYLLHYPLFHFIGKLTKGIHPFDNFYHNLIVQGLVVLPIAFSICCVYFLLIEKPCMDKEWPQKLYAFIKKRILLQTNS